MYKRIKGQTHVPVFDAYRGQHK